jgi:hypothetical protein
MLLIFFASFSTFLISCSRSISQTDSQKQNAQNLKIIAEEVSQGVGNVRMTSEGSRGAPIIILEENHAVRAGQIEHAITLVRLHDRYGLKDIALEGYLKEHPEIKTDWFNTAASGLNASSRAAIAIGFLKEGEISCSEFMKLAYEDITLHPIEVSKEYDMELNQEDYFAPFLYLLKIAERSLTEEHVSTLNQLKEDMDRADRENNVELREKKRKEMLDYILSVDSWVQDKAKILQDAKTFSAMSQEYHLTLINEIINRANTLSIELKANEKNAMERYLKFFRERINANKTMVISTGEIADYPEISIVVLNSGSAHTDGMLSFLKNSNRPYAVIRPLSFEESDIPSEMFLRKYQGISLYSKGFTEIILNAFPSIKYKKPRPVLSQPWFQGKVELYLFTQRIVQGVLGPPEPPGNPPFGFGKDDFNGKRVFIDPNSIQIIADRKDKKTRAVLFPAILNADDPSRKTKIWIKGVIGVSNVTKEERESVESMLMKALQEMKTQKKLDSKVEDKFGRIQITQEVIAAFGETQEEVRKVVLGSI